MTSIPPYYVTLITLLLILATVSSQQFRHPKLIENEGSISSDGQSEIIQNAYIIRLNGGVKSVRNAVSRLMVASTQDGGSSNYEYKHAFKGFSVSGMSNLRMTEILDSPIVLSAERSSKCSTTSTTIQYNASWNLDMLTAAYEDSTYEHMYNGTGVRAYIIDSGLDINNVQFGNRATCGWDAYKSNCKDKFGHGTHVAGTIGSTTYGVAKQVSLVGVKAMSNDGSGTWETVIAGVEWVISQKRKNPTVPMIINMSLGGWKNTLVNKAVATASKLGITVVVSAGNDYGFDACYKSPASTPRAITVGSTNSTNNTVSAFSNGGTCIDIMAPGELVDSVTSCARFPANCSTPSRLSGTSMSTPLVAGVVALHLQKNGSLTPFQVRRAIRDDARLNVVNDVNNYQVPNILLSVSSTLL